MLAAEKRLTKIYSNRIHGKGPSVSETAPFAHRIPGKGPSVSENPLFAHRCPSKGPSVSETAPFAHRNPSKGLSVSKMPRNTHGNPVKGRQGQGARGHPKNPSHSKAPYRQASPSRPKAKTRRPRLEMTSSGARLFPTFPRLLPPPQSEKRSPGRAGTPLRN